jgi:hypothetical protein
VAVTLLDYLRAYLISTGDARDPRVPGPSTGPPYPLWREPDLGAVPPRQKDDPQGVETNDELVISAFRSTGLPRPRDGTYSRVDMIELWLRSARPDVALDFWDNRLRKRFIAPNGMSKTAWNMGNSSLGTIWVLETLIFRELQRLGSDDQGWTWMAELSFMVQS